MARPKISEAVRLEVIERDGVYCRYCGHGPMRLSWRSSNGWKVFLRCLATSGDLGTLLNLDHLDAVANGGKSSAENLAVSCARCNMSKGMKGRRKLRPPAPLSLLPEPTRRAVAQRELAGGW